MTDLSIVIPVYNEEQNVTALVREIDAALQSLVHYEIVVVNDGSTDGTGEQLSAARRELPRLRVVRHERNCGQSTAILTGVRFARAPWVATMDGDGQNNPADIVRLLRVRDGCRSSRTPVLVAGRRVKRSDNLVRRLSSRVANAVRGRLLRDGTRDTGCGLKLFERDAFLSLPRFDHMHRFVPALFKRLGGEIITVEVDSRPRLYGCSKYGISNRLWAGIIDTAGMMWLNRRAIRQDGIEVES